MHGVYPVICRISPIAPTPINRRALVKNGFQRRVQLMANTTLYSRQTLTMASASSQLMGIGFSAQMALIPALAASGTIFA